MRKSVLTNRIISDGRVRALPLLLAAIGILLVAAGCGSSSSDSSSSGSSGSTAESGSEPGASKPVSSGDSSGPLIGESSPIESNPNLHALTYGAETAAAEVGFSFRSLDANLSPNKQVSDLDTLSTLGAKGLITLTLDPGAADAAYKRAFEKEIPIVGYNSTSQFIQTNIAQQTDTTCKPGNDAAAYIAERIPNAEVLVVGGPPVPSQRLRTACFAKAAKAEGLDVVETEYNLEDTTTAAQPIVQSMLEAHPEADAIFAYNDPSALGAGAVLRTLGKQAWSGEEEGVIVIGINGTDEAAKAIEAGIITATYDPNSPEAGAAAIAVLALHLEEGVPLSKLPKEVVIKTKRWDAENISEYVNPLEREVTAPKVAAEP